MKDKVRDTAEDTVGGTAENKVGDKVREHFFWTLCNPYTPHPGNQGSPLLEPGQWPRSCGFHWRDDHTQHAMPIVAAGDSRVKSQATKKIQYFLQF